jgi:hypothetical protein
MPHASGRWHDRPSRHGGDWHHAECAGIFARAVSLMRGVTAYAVARASAWATQRSPHHSDDRQGQRHSAVLCRLRCIACKWDLP